MARVDRERLFVVECIMLVIREGRNSRFDSRCLAPVIAAAASRQLQTNIYLKEYITISSSIFRNIAFWHYFIPNI